MKNNIGKISASTTLSALIVLGLVSHVDTADALAKSKGTQKGFLQEFNANNPGLLPVGGALVVGGILIGGGYFAYQYKKRSDEKTAQEQTSGQPPAIPANFPNSTTPNSSDGNNAPEVPEVPEDSEPTESPRPTGLEAVIHEPEDTPTASPENSDVEKKATSPTDDSSAENAEDESRYSGFWGGIKRRYDKLTQKNRAEKHLLETKRAELKAKEDAQDQEASLLRGEQNTVDRSEEKVSKYLSTFNKKQEKYRRENRYANGLSHSINNRETDLERAERTHFIKDPRQVQDRIQTLQREINESGVGSKEQYDMLEELRDLKRYVELRNERQARIGVSLDNHRDDKAAKAAAASEADTDESLEHFKILFSE